MAITFTCKRDLLLVDAYLFEWEYEGKKGTTGMIGLYDYEDHRYYQCPYDCDLSKFSIGEIYKFDLTQVSMFGKAKMKVVGVSNVRN